LVNVSEIAQDYYIRGLNDVSEGNYMKAIYNFEYTLKLEKSTAVYISLAEAYLAVNNIYNALEASIEAFKLDTKNKKALEIMFSIFSYVGDFEAAEKVGLEMYLQYPTSKNILAIADLYFSVNNPKAIDYYEEYLQKEQDSTVEDKYLTLLINQKQFQKALQKLKMRFQVSQDTLQMKQFTWIAVDTGDYNEIDELYKYLTDSSSKNMNSFFDNLIMTLTTTENKNGEYPNFSKKYLNLLKDYDSTLLETDFNSTVLAFNIKDTSLVEIFSDKTLSKIDTNQTYPLIISEIYKRIGLKVQELNTLLKFQAKFPENDEYMLLLGYWYYQEKQFENALLYFTKYKDKKPEEAGRYVSLGDVYEKINDYKSAEKNYLKALELDEDNTTANNNFAYFLTKFPERLAEAENYAKRALLIEPETAAFLDTYGWILFLQNKQEDALKVVLDASKLDSLNWEIWDHLGDIYYSLEDKQNAINSWRRAMELNLDNPSFLNKIKKSLEK
jgi:Flp pilus assembly protein TadD